MKVKTERLFVRVPRVAKQYIRESAEESGCSISEYLMLCVFGKEWQGIMKEAEEEAVDGEELI